MSDTDRFVRTMSPLVDDPDVQTALTNRLTATVFQYVDVQRIADDAVAALAAQGLPPQLVDRLGTLTPTLTSAVTGFVRDRIAELVASPAFASAWNQAIQVAHRQMDAVLSGDSDSVVVRGDTVFLDLAPFIDLAKERLSDAGLTAVDLVPDVHPTVALAKADTLVRAQSAYSALDTVAGVLPWIVLLLLAVGRLPGPEQVPRAGRDRAGHRAGHGGAGRGPARGAQPAGRCRSAGGGARRRRPASTSS